MKKITNGVLLKRCFAACLMLVLGPVLNAQEVIPLAKDLPIERQGKRELKFKLTDIPEENWFAKGHQVRLSLDARIQWVGLGGYTGGMEIRINDKGLVGGHLINKPLIATLRNGSIFEWAKKDSSSYLLYYSADFSDKTKSLIKNTYIYGFPEDREAPFHFVWDITSYVKPGSNTVTVQASPTPRDGISLANISVEIGPPVASVNKAIQVSPAPTGPLEVYMPKNFPELPVIYVSPAGNIRYSTEKRTFNIRSRTSLPNGQWTGDNSGREIWRELRQGESFVASWNGHNYAVRRKITLYSDHIAVADTVTNTSDQLVGVIFENRLLLPAGHEQVMVNGLKCPFKMVAQYKDTITGMVAEDDILRLHAEPFAEKDALGFVDRQLGIAPGKSHTLEWSIYMLPNGDYWDFINAVRRNLDCNFTMQGPVVFPCHKRFNYVNSKSQTADSARAWLKEMNNSAPWVMTHVAVNPSIAMKTATKDNPSHKHGTAILDANRYLDITRILVQLLKEADPKIKVFAYLHKNLCTEVGYKQKYRDSVAMNEQGLPAPSPYSPEMGVFVPTLENSYGKAMTEVYKYLVTNLDANIYIDEISNAYLVPGDGDTVWDGCTVVINPVSHAVIRKRSSPFLLVQPWLQSMMDYLKANGKTAFANTAPPTRTVANWKLQHFAEDYGPGGVMTMHLSTPLCHSYSQGIQGYQHLMRSLDYGGIAFSRGGDWSDHMFPITPIELRAGIVIAQERILTNRSGQFGWGDNSRAEVYVFDGQGNRVEKPDVKEVGDGGKVLTELRMPSDHMAILVRKNNK